MHTCPFGYELMSYSRCLCLLAHSDVQQTLCCGFLRIVCPMLPVSLDCPFWIVPSIFSNVYLVILRLYLYFFVVTGSW